MREFWRQRKVRQVIGEVGRSTLYEWIAAGSFPAPISIGKRAVAWDSTAVLKWMEDRLKGDKA
jgi:prophage regulatory protein